MVEVHGVLERTHPSFPGHFPDAPLAAGVVVLGRVLRAFRETHAGLRVAGIAAAKFPAPLLPGVAYTVRFERRGPARVAFECRRTQDVVARGELEVESSSGAGVALRG
ncbi:MAG: hydroxymyristoyl-ACP dehydratase [Gammaproteobacteria bacterium]